MTPIADTINRLLPETERFLCDCMRFPSTPGREQDLMLHLHTVCAGLNLAVERMALTDALKADPDYSTPVEGIAYDGRFNLRLARAGAGGGRTLLLNAHTDVVPPSPDMTDPWNPRIADGVVFGRGACDDKGQVAVAYLALRALDALDIKLRGDVITHLVVEEENGGNGSLACARRGEHADGCIVLEPSDRRIYTSIRGAVWFHITFRGRAGHSGQPGATRSALLMARDAIGVLERYHAELLRNSRGFPLFDVHPNPMPITFGSLESGTWPATAPDRAVLRGVLGLLPNRTRDQVCAEMRAALYGADIGLNAENCDVRFLYRHDCSVLDPAHALPQGLLASTRAAGAPFEIGAMTASCDACYYSTILNIPTVVFGAGSIKTAHSKDEQIALADIARAAETLVRFIIDYCGEVA